MFEILILFSQFGFGSLNNRYFMNKQIQDSPEISGIRFTVYVLPFAISQTLAWATCFYSFPAFLPIWETQLGFSKTSLTGAYTLSLFVAAVFAPFVGRFIDKGFGNLVFSFGTVLAFSCLFLLSNATEIWHFYFLWFFMGIAMSCSLYEACFAFLTNTLANKARRAITFVTLAAGFGGTISFLSAHFLTQFLGWRSAILVFSLVILIVNLPLVLSATKMLNKFSKGFVKQSSGNLKDALSVVKKPIFWLLGGTFAFMSLNHGMLVSHLLPIFYDRGLDVKTAVLAASCIGPMQVIGRLMMLASEKRVSVLSLCSVSFISLFIAGCSIYLGNLSLGFIIAFVVFQGASYGVLSIIRPTVISGLLGRNDFGIISGLLAVGFMLGSALAPLFGSLVWQLGTYDLVIFVALLLPAFAFLLLIAAWRLKPR
jgi:MFS family permease